MARGGYRPGSGRKSGVADKLKEAKRIASEGLTPLDYLLSIVRDEGAAKPERVDAAKAAAPYVHPRLATVEQKGDLSLTVKVEQF